MKQKNKITIVEVAKTAKVSIATVSRIINGNAGYSKETEDHVWNVIHQLGYEPSLHARTMRRGSNNPERIKNNLIMRIINSGTLEITSAVSRNIVHFEMLAQQYGLFSTTYLYNGLSAFRCPLLLDRLIDGAVLGSPHGHVIEAVYQKVPCVLLNVKGAEQYPELVRINSAKEQGIYELLSAAYKKGHRKAAFAGAPEDHLEQNTFSQHYGPAYIEQLRACGFTLEKKYCFRPSDLNNRNHTEKMKEIAGQLIPAIKRGNITFLFCEDTPYAYSLYKELTDAGVRIPDDVAIAAYDGKLYYHNESPISSIYTDWDTQMRLALSTLNLLIDGKTPDRMEYNVTPLWHEGTTL